MCLGVSLLHTHWSTLPHTQHLPVFPSRPAAHCGYSSAGPTGRGSIPHIFPGGKVKEGAVGLRWGGGPEQNLSLSALFT